MESRLVREARLLAEQVFADPVFAQFPFHNLEHTRDVVDAVKEVGVHTHLTSEEMEAALAAAWLHDTGYIAGATDHERHSVAMAKELFQRLDTPVGVVNMISSAIMSTQMPQQPRSMVDKVLCDADLAHLASPMCEPRSDALRDELNARGESFSDDEWKMRTIAFMQQHHYHTSYGQTVLEDGKKKNIRHLKKRGSETISDINNGSKKIRKMREENDKLRAKLSKAKDARHESAIDLYFRTASHNMVMLSHTADNKASILMAVNAIILTSITLLLIGKWGMSYHLMYPAILLAGVCLVTMVFSILANRLNVTLERDSRTDLKSMKTKLSLFDAFRGIGFDDYQRGVSETMKDPDYLRGSMIKEVYRLGKILGKKCYYLSIAYGIFMYGSVVSIIAFCVAYGLARNGHL